jgi:hypothetical protein
MELRIGVLNSLETNGEIDLEVKKELGRSAPSLLIGAVIAVRPQDSHTRGRKKGRSGSWKRP